MNIKFGFETKNAVNPKTSEITKQQITAKSSKIIDPYEKIIIEDLGGMEIN